jgi:hypothetical protein
MRIGIGAGTVAALIGLGVVTFMIYNGLMGG